MSKTSRTKRAVSRKREAPIETSPKVGETGASRTALVAAAWLAVLAVYLLLFYTAPIAFRADRPPSPRAKVLLWLFTPELYWETWTADGTMRLTLLDRLPVAATAGTILVWGGVLGWAALTLGGATRRLSRLETFVFAEGVGLQLLSLLTLGAGLAGWLDRPIAWILPAILGSGALAATAFWKQRRRAEPPRDAEQAARTELRWPSAAWLALGAPAVFVIVLGGMLPPWEFDTREYHLQVPKEWFRKGRIDFLPHNVYGNMPLGAELHAVLAMCLMPGERSWWWGALAGKTVMAAFTPLTALGLFAAGRRYFSNLAGVVAATVYIAIPWVVLNAVIGMNDHVLACYTFLGLFAVLAWRSEGQSPPLLALGAFLAGAAAACKYTGVVFAVIPLGAMAVLIAWASPRAKQQTEDERSSPKAPQNPSRPATGVRLRRALLTACGFALFAALAAGPWYVKNWALAGNPVFPLMYDVFGGRGWTPEKAERWRLAHQVPRSENLGPYAPQRLIASLAQVGWRSEWLSPILIPLALLAPLQRRSRQVLGWTAGLGFCIFAAWWLFTHRIDRFLIPAMPAAALLGGAGADWTLDRRWGRFMLGVAALGMGANFLVFASPVAADNRYFAALEDLRTDAGDEVTGALGRVNWSHQFLNENVPEGGAVLLVGEAQVFDIEPPAYYNTCFDDCVFEQLMKGRSAEERRAALRERNITHVYVLWGEIARYRSPGNYGYWDYVQLEVFDELVAQGVLRPAGPPEAFLIERTPNGYPPARVYEVAP